jgi:putative ABC transport system permease protein
MLLETIRLALRSIRRNVLRSFLTLLGIVIGVAAVIAMLTIGSGTTEKVKSDIAKLGSNLLIVYAGRQPAPGAPPNQQPKELTQREVDALRSSLEGARAVSGASQKQVRVVFGTESLTVGVTGTDAGYFSARDWDVISGRPFTEAEVRGGAIQRAPRSGSGR